MNHLPAASQALPRIAIDDHGQVHLQRRRCQLLHTAARSPRAAPPALHNMANTAKDQQCSGCSVGKLFIGGVHDDVCVGARICVVCVSPTHASAFSVTDAGLMTQTSLGLLRDFAAFQLFPDL